MDLNNTETNPTWDFEAGAREGMAEYEQKWRAGGQTFAWIDRRPKWMPITCWGPPIDILPDPTAPCLRAWRFSLIGGGQIKITEHWTLADWKGRPPDLPPFWNSKTTLTIAAHTEQGLHIYRGEIGGFYAEMRAHAVLLRGSGEELQAIADRAAATFRALTTQDENAERGGCTEPDRDRFYALLDGARGCSICGRALRDEISKLIGVGPDCAHSLGIPHSRAAASKRLELRKQILGGHA